MNDGEELWKNMAHPVGSLVWLEHKVHVKWKREGEAALDGGNDLGGVVNFIMR